MKKLTLALAAALAFGAASTAMARSWHPARTDASGLQQRSAVAGQAYGRALDSAVVIRDGEILSTDPDARIRAQLRHNPDPSVY